MTGILPYIVQLILGAIGGWVTGQAVKSVSLGTLGNVVAGAVGGVVLTWIAAYIPGIAGWIGVGALDGGGTSALIGQGIVSLIGGGVLTAIIGAVRGSMAKS
ncbi:MAG: hypothetical protein WEB63_04575 [Cucumibacter sp.]